MKATTKTDGQNQRILTASKLLGEMIGERQNIHLNIENKVKNTLSITILWGVVRRDQIYIYATSLFLPSVELYL